MDKIVPPVELKSEESARSAEFILNIGPSEPAEYIDVCQIELHCNNVVHFIANFPGILRSRANPMDGSRSKRNVSEIK